MSVLDGVAELQPASPEQQQVMANLSARLQQLSDEGFVQIGPVVSGSQFNAAWVLDNVLRQHEQGRTEVTTIN